MSHCGASSPSSSALGQSRRGQPAAALRRRALRARAARVLRAAAAVRRPRASSWHTFRCASQRSRALSSASCEDAVMCSSTRSASGRGVPLGWRSPSAHRRRGQPTFLAFDSARCSEMVVGVALDREQQLEAVRDVRERRVRADGRVIRRLRRPRLAPPRREVLPISASRGASSRPPPCGRPSSFLTASSSPHERLAVLWVS